MFFSFWDDLFCMQKAYPILVILVPRVMFKKFEYILNKGYWFHATIKNKMFQIPQSCLIFILILMYFLNFVCCGFISLLSFVNKP